MINLKVFSMCFLFTFFSMNQLLAKEFGCFPSPKQNFIKAQETKDTIDFQVYNPRGYQEMAQSMGPISPLGLNFLQWQFQALQDLGSQFNFKWPRSQCQVEFSTFKINCQGSATQSPKYFQAQTIKTITILEESGATKFSKLRYQIPLEKQGDIFFLNLEFFTPTCQYRP